MRNIQEQVEVATRKILELAGLEGEVRVVEKNNQILVEIESPAAGLLIGRKGQNLRALERILQVIFYDKLSKDKIITVDVEGFRAKRTQLLDSLVEDAVEKVKETGEPQTLTGLSATERKAVHLKIAQNANLTSESQGIGNDRVLIIKSKV